MFTQEEHVLGHTDIIKHKISLIDDNRVKWPYRRISPTHIEEVKEHNQFMSSKGLTRPSTRENSSPIVLVRKKSGSPSDVFRLSPIKCAHQK